MLGSIRQAAKRNGEAMFNIPIQPEARPAITFTTSTYFVIGRIKMRGRVS